MACIEDMLYSMWRSVVPLFSSACCPSKRRTGRWSGSCCAPAAVWDASCASAVWESPLLTDDHTRSVIFNPENQLASPDIGTSLCYVFSMSGINEHFCLQDIHKELLAFVSEENSPSDEVKTDEPPNKRMRVEEDCVTPAETDSDICPLCLGILQDFCDSTFAKQVCLFIIILVMPIKNTIPQNRFPLHKTTTK